MKGDCSNILVRGVNWIGDAVMTMPSLRALRKSQPDARITLLVNQWVAPLFERNPHIDEIIIYQDKHKGVPGKLRLAKMLKKYNFCMAVFFQNAFDAAITGFLAGIPERIGYSRDGRGFLLTCAVPFDARARGLHHVEYYLNMLGSCGFVSEYSLPWIFLALEERLRARNIIRQLKQPVVAINPGATYGSSKRWGSGRFADVAHMIISETNGSVVILGGPSEIQIAEEIYQTVSSRKLDGNNASRLLFMAGRTGLRELCALISECDALVTNDSGPMHIGYAVGTPVVAIFGSTSPELTGPVGKDAVVIRKNLECSPCFERECRKEGLECMDMISPEEVYGAVKKVLHNGRAVFFDRDGTLCKDTGYLNRIEDFEILPGINSLAKLKQAGFSLIGITNQSAIARGLTDEGFVKEVNDIFIREYGFDAFYYCPHHPDDNCSCRKPEPGLLYRARAENNINLKNSFVVGDKETDMLLAKSAGATGVFVTTGQEDFSSHADFVVKDIQEAVRIIETH